MKTNAKKTALHIAAEKGYSEICLKIINAYIDRNKIDIRCALILMKDKTQATPFHVAAANGHIVSLQFWTFKTF